MDQIEDLDKEIEAGSTTTQVICDKESKLAEFQRVAEMEEVSWRQKSRLLWLTQGDNNTKFFHNCAKVRQSLNSISTLRCNGTLTTDLGIIKTQIVDFYTNLYKEEEQWRPRIDGLEFPTISDTEQQLMERIFTEEEVFAAIKSLGQEKAPGPDGFPMVFFYKFWNMLKIDVMQVVSEFYHHASFDWRLNATFITLLPKIDQVEDVKDFRPISLLSSTYKIVSKVLASRLKKLLPKLPSEHQSAYIKGRQIADGILMANELVDSRIRSTVPGLICKVDMEKAFDRVSWDYIDYILFRMGFGTLWRRWIQACMSSASFSILINGASCGFFTSSRGVRQGDPLSPLLFDLAMEGLSKLIQRATDLKQISGFQVRRVAEPISHLHYADDTIIFLDADQEQLAYTLSILKCFEVVSGLKINLAKTKIINVGAVAQLKAWASEFGCGTDQLPTKYLGVPLGATQRARATWDPILTKFDKRLSQWKGKQLSNGGKLTLINATLSNLPIYYLSVLLAPIKIVNAMEIKL